MDIASFLNDNFLVLPKTYKKAEDFRKFVYRLLDEFVEKLNTIHKSNMQFDNIDFSMDSIIARQKHLVSYIKKALDYYYDGKPAKAYQSLVDGLESNVKDYSTILNIRSFPANSNFYRLRVWKDNYPLPSDEFFHIPFDKRGKVKTQRFSIPGFPSLYLGTTVYVCWEELNRPNINEFQAVRLKNIQDIKVIDLSPPKNEVHSSYDYYRFLMIWPLVLKSAVRSQ